MSYFENRTEFSVLFSVLFPEIPEFGRSPEFREQGTALVSSCYVTSDVGQSKHFCSYPRTSPVLKCGRKNQPSFRVHNQEPGQFLIVDLRTSFQFRSKIQDRRIAASAIPSSQDRKLFPSIGDKQVSGYLHFQFISLNKNVFLFLSETCPPRLCHG